MTDSSNIVAVNADEAFVKTASEIISFGEEKSNNYCIYNCLIQLNNPMDNEITYFRRNWSKKYAEAEWEWYRSGNPNAEEISKIGSIWKNHMDEDGNVHSNYGYQWLRNDQLEKVVAMLKDRNETRRAVLTLYDGKEIDKYVYDTPCTTSIQFQIRGERLDMTVSMRSNDLWFGFCNDQYCFSKLQELVAFMTSCRVGKYYHFAANMHLYKPQYKKLWT